MNLLRALRYARYYRNWRELEQARAAGRKPARAVLRDGTSFEAPAGVNPLRVLTPVFHKRVYTPPGFEIGADDTVVDVGANIGAFAVYAAQRTRGRVLAIEPHPENAEHLRLNLRANHCQRAEVAECAISDAPGTLPLFIGKSGTTHQLTPLGKDAGAGESVDVRVATFAQVLAEHGFERVDFLKLDCEGAEGVILPALPVALMAAIRTIALEFHDDASVLAHDALAKLLEQKGFRVALDWDGRSANGMLFARR
ncbi:MAG TPA: FkbM family methyltransferase [Myxococcota bacterium]|nr:FkbM family methyltransferase [Myxococcota bacterium]